MCICADNLQACQRAETAEQQLAAALSQIAQLRTDLAGAEAAVAESKVATDNLGQRLGAEVERAVQAEGERERLQVERDAAAGNLVKAEKELVAVGEYSSKMFRQVGFWGEEGRCQGCVVVGWGWRGGGGR